MAAPCRNLSLQLFRVFQGSACSSSFSRTLLQCRRLHRSKHPSLWHFRSSRIECRPLSTSWKRFSSTNPTGKPEGERPKAGIIKKIALKIHHATIWFLNRVSPKARVFYERFVDGATSFVQDFRFVYSLNKRLKKGEVRLEDLEWKDLYKKMQMKQDVAKVLPVLVIVNIPFVYYVTLPIVLYFQRIFLSDHFISAEDVSSNHRENHKKRRRLYPSILKRLDQRLETKPVSELAESLHKRIAEVQLEKHPLSSAELLSFQPLFSRQTSLKSLSRNHLKYLCKLHSQWAFLAPSSTLRIRLSTHSALMVAMDRAILRGGIHSIDEQDLRKLCYQRGLNPVESDRETLIQWLQEWTRISTNVTDLEWSLLLHASVLLVTGRPHQGDEPTVKSDIASTSNTKDVHQV